MADGLLGGFGDFLTGGGIYADPKAINPTYGVPEGDVRQAAINQLAQLSALALAAGQPMEGAQRAQLLAQMGQTGGQFNTNLYNASQRRLMTAQMQEKQRDIEELGAIRDLQQKDPEGLARRFGGGITAEMIKSFSASDLREVAKKIAIERATKPGSEVALTEAFARQGVAIPQPAAPTPPAAGAGTPVQAQTPPTAGLGAYTSMAIPPGTSPQDMATINAYKAALNDPRIARDPKQIKLITDALDALMPGAKEASVQKAKRQEELVANRPKADLTVQSSDEDTRLITGIVDDAVNLIDKEGRFVAGTFGSRLVERYEPATNLRGQIDAIRSRIGMGKIQEMKSQSATGATGLGPIAVRELDRLEASLGNLDQAQSPDELKKRLLSIKESLNRYNDSVRQSYKSTYGEEPGLGSPDQVKAAVQSGRITRDQGLQILRSKFGM